MLIIKIVLVVLLVFSALISWFYGAVGDNENASEFGGVFSFFLFIAVMLALFF